MWNKTLRELKVFEFRRSANARETSASMHQICMSLNTAFLKMVTAIFNNYYINISFQFVQN